MSHKRSIKCETLELENPYGANSVTIQNSRGNAPIIFNNQVKFNQDIIQSSVVLGSYQIKVDGENLVIQKNGITIFTFSE